MPLHENDHYHMMVVGDYHPVKVMDGNRTVFQAKEQEQSGAILPFVDTYNDKFQPLRIHGATQQTVTVQGKNLFNPAVGSITTSGITITVESDGTITFNGTATAGRDVYLTKELRASPLPSPGIETQLVFGEKYALYVTQISGASSSSSFSFNASDRQGTSYPAHVITNAGVSSAGVSTVRIITAGTPHVTNASTSLEIGQWRCFFSEGSVFSNYKVRVQFERSATVTTWEPFIPNSPSPDYPAPITGIEPDAVTVLGKENLLDITATPNNTLNITSADITDYSIILTTTATLSQSRYVYTLPVEKYTDYVLIADAERLDSIGEQSYTRILIRESGGTILGTVDVDNVSGKQSKTFAFNSGDRNTVYLWLYPKATALSDKKVVVKFSNVRVVAAPYTGTTIPLPDMGPVWGGGYRDYAQGIDYAEQAHAVIDGVNANGHAYAYQIIAELDSTVQINMRCNNIVSAQGSYVWCDKLPYANNNQDFPHIRGQGAINNQFTVFLPKSVLPVSPTYQIVNTYLAANPMQMVRVLGAAGSVPPTTVVPVITHFTPITIPTYPKHTVISAEGAQITAKCRVFY